MVKVVQPLFGVEAHGTVAGLLTFRRGSGGAQVIASSGGPRQAPAATEKIRACFAEAKAAHAASPVKRVKRGRRWVEVHTVTWPDFWRTWLNEHPECRQ